MGTSNRAALLVKTHKILKKHYTPVAAGDRPLLGQLLFALCLENSTYEAAEKVLAELEKGFFDWNEVRVSTVTELAELMAPLRDAKYQANNVKRALQSIFEATYSFDLEAMKKKNLGQAIKELEKMSGVTPFAIGYVTQTSLGGHAIPLDKGALDALHVLGIASDKEAAAGEVPGVERAIPKNKGVEFGSLLHQLGVDLLAKPFSNDVRDIFLSIAPDAKDRLPKRGVKKPEPPPAPVETKPAKPAETAEKATPVAAKGKGKPAPAAKTTQPAKPTLPAKPAAPAKAEAPPKVASPAKSATPPKPAPPAKKPPPPPAKKEVDSKRGKPPARPASKKLAKSKPR
jgi:endonuclease III